MSERLFYVYRQGGSGELGLGIAERRDGETVYIASLYYEGDFSRKEVFDLYSHHIGEKLEPGQQARIVTNDMSCRSKNRLRYPRNSYFVSNNRSHLWEVKRLAMDGLARKTNIMEVL